MPQDLTELMFTLDKEYQLRNDASEVTLDVTIGEKEQSPDIKVRLNTKVLLEHHKTSIKNMLIDRSDKLAGKTLKITGNVTDTASDSNKIEVRLRVKGGLQDLDRKFSVTVQDDGEVVDLAFVIRFTL